MLDRTLMRPRDIIIFFNACIRLAGNNAVITAEMVKTAEGEYSRSRLRSIADEWSGEYSDLILMEGILKGKRDTITLSDLSDEECLDLSINLLSSTTSKTSELENVLKAAERTTTDYEALRRYLALAFYRVGLVGLKLTAYDPIVWSIGGRRSVSVAEISSATRLHLHPCFWRSLGI